MEYFTVRLVCKGEEVGTVKAFREFWPNDFITPTGEKAEHEGGKLWRVISYDATTTPPTAFVRHPRDPCFSQ